MFGREGSDSYRGYKCTRGTVGADRIPQNRVCSILSLCAFFSLFALKNKRVKEMDNWKIQFIVVTFVAFLQTYEAVSSTAEEERRLLERWQVSFL